MLRYNVGTKSLEEQRRIVRLDEFREIVKALWRFSVGVVKEAQ
jgi:hypothetical protein